VHIQQQQHQQQQQQQPHHQQSYNDHQQTGGGRTVTMPSATSGRISATANSASTARPYHHQPYSTSTRNGHEVGYDDQFDGRRDRNDIDQYQFSDMRYAADNDYFQKYDDVDAAARYEDTRRSRFH
jgi:hypothetical protein